MARWIFHNKTLIETDRISPNPPSFVNQLYFLPNTNPDILTDITEDPNRNFYSGRTVISAADNGVNVMAVYTGAEGIVASEDRVIGDGLFVPVGSANTTQDVGYNNLNQFTHEQWVEETVKKGHIVVIKDAAGIASTNALSGIYIMDFAEEPIIDGKQVLSIHEPYGYAVLYWNGSDNWHVISQRGASGWNL